MQSKLIFQIISLFFLILFADFVLELNTFVFIIWTILILYNSYLIFKSTDYGNNIL